MRSITLLVEDGCLLTEIEDHKVLLRRYRVEMATPPGAAWGCWLHRQDECVSYGIHITREGWVRCTCPAYTYCKVRPHRCKHTEVAESLKMLLESLTTPKVTA